MPPARKSAVPAKPSPAPSLSRLARADSGGLGSFLKDLFGFRRRNEAHFFVRRVLSIDEDGVHDRQIPRRADLERQLPSDDPNGMLER